MKINFKVRAKNIWFWVGLGGVILTAMGVSPEMFTSWEIVKEQAIALVSNPFMLVSVILAVLGQIVDPTTSGITDSVQAMEYSVPKRDE